MDTVEATPVLVLPRLSWRPYTVCVELSKLLLRGVGYERLGQDAAVR